MSLPSEFELSSNYWEQRYQEGRTGWDLGQPAPPFVTLLERADAPKSGRMAVLGAGRGYDALLFANRGFEITGFDLAPSAIAYANHLAHERQLPVTFLQRDIFYLEPEFYGKFDYVLEHTCFCAIAPSQRDAYVDVVHRLLQPAGELIALFWAHAMSGGPPFGTTVAELHQRFLPKFEIRFFELATNSVESRRNAEYLARFSRKDNYV